MHVALFSECYRPVQNGVVASIDALRDGLHSRGVDVTTVTPRVPRFVDTSSDIARTPSLPLPTDSGYRLCIPYLRERDRARLRDVDVVHANSPFVTGAMAASLARRRRAPLIFTYHTRLDAYAHYAPFDPDLTRRALIMMTRRYANACDAVIVPTRAMELGLRELGVRVRIAVVPSGIDSARFGGATRSAQARTRLGAGDGEPLVLAVARLGREKNLELAIDAVALLPDVHLAIAGDGPQRAALDAHARRRGIADRVRFLGSVARDDLPTLYASADAFAFSSTTDTQGLVLAEAMAAGLPIVAADSPATRDVLGPVGSIVAADAVAMAAGIRAAVITGRDQSAVHLAHAGFSIESQTRDTVRLYEELIAAHAT